MDASTPEKIVYVYYQDDIDGFKVKSIMGIVANLLATQNPTVLYLLLSSHGGEVDAGVTLYNFLKSLPVKIVTHNIGTIDSIANIIFAAGKERYAVPHSVFLFHGVQMNLNGQLSLPQVDEIRDRIIKNHETIAGILNDNTLMTIREIKKLFKTGETKDVRFALKKGIIHKIKSAELPKDALFISININR